MDVTIWNGPVNLAQANGCWAPGSKPYSLDCRGDGTPSCAAQSEAWTDGAGRKIPNALAHFGLAEESVDELDLAAFSAGGSVVKRLTLAPADCTRVRVVYLADAMYTDWLSPGKPTPPEGFVLFALQALAGPHLLVATVSSNPNPTKSGVLPSGSQTMAAVRAEIEKRSGLSFVQLGDIPGLMVQPAAAWQLGNVILADYQARVPHGGHATTLAPNWWKAVVLPWIATGSAPSSEGPPSPPLPPASPPAARPASEDFSGLCNAAAFVAGAGLAFLAVRALT